MVFTAAEVCLLMGFGGGIVYMVLGSMLIIILDGFSHRYFPVSSLGAVSTALLFVLWPIGLFVLWGVTLVGRYWLAHAKRIDRL